MAHHTLNPERRFLHGSFSRELPPVLSIAPGDTVRYRLLEADWGLENFPADPDRPARRCFEPRDPEKDAGHALAGPVEIRGARAGMTLAVEIGEIVPGDWGWTCAGGWPSDFNERLGLAAGAGFRLLWELDVSTMTGRNQFGQTLELRPFLGVLGMPPDLPGRHSTAPPRACGGNLDCRELVAGSTLYLPIPVDGALFSCGDGHARQGDGELTGTAIECPIARADLTFHLIEDMPLTLPRARTAEGWLTFGFHCDLSEAVYLAAGQMLELISDRFEMTRKEAAALASAVVDLRITQIVNGVRGAHAFLPHHAIKASVNCPRR